MALQVPKSEILQSLGILWFLHHKVSMRGCLWGKKKYIYLGVHWGPRNSLCVYGQSDFKECSSSKHAEHTHQELIHTLSIRVRNWCVHIKNCMHTLSIRISSYAYGQHKPINSEFEKGLQNMRIMRVRNCSARASEIIHCKSDSFEKYLNQLYSTYHIAMVWFCENHH